MPTDRSPPPGIAPTDPSPAARWLAITLQKEHGNTGERALLLWKSLAASLVNIIGDEGFDALFSRSLHLAGAAHPWLAEASVARGNVPRFAALKALLNGRTQAEVTAAMVLLFCVFTDVLGTLIGNQLTTNILRAAWGDAYEEAAQETSPWPKK